MRYLDGDGGAGQNGGVGPGRVGELHKGLQAVQGAPHRRRLQHRCAGCVDGQRVAFVDAAPQRQVRAVDLDQQLREVDAVACRRRRAVDIQGCREEQPERPRKRLLEHVRVGARRHKREPAPGPGPADGG